MEPVNIGGHLIVRQEDLLFVIGPIGSDSGGFLWYDVRLPHFRVAASAEDFERIQEHFALSPCTYIDKSGRPFKAHVNKPAVFCTHKQGRTNHVYFIKSTCVLEVIATEAEEQNMLVPIPDVLSA